MVDFTTWYREHEKWQKGGNSIWVGKKQKMWKREKLKKYNKLKQHKTN